MSFPDSGNIFYRDDYDTLYEVIWETVTLDGSEVLDFTTIIKQPYVWGEAAQGYIKDRVVYRRGVCTTIRQIFIAGSDGYVILAEGMSQVICVFPTTFSGAGVPTDEFEHHVDSAVSDFLEYEVTCGPRYSDPEDVDAHSIVFADVDAGGNIVHIPGAQTFQFVNVWGQDDNIYSYDCSSPSPSPSISAFSASISAFSASISVSPSISLSPSVSISLSSSISVSPSPSVSISLSSSISVSPSPSVSISLSSSISVSPSSSISASISLSPSVSLSLSPSISGFSASISLSPSVSLSLSPSISGFSASISGFSASPSSGMPEGLDEMFARQARMPTATWGKEYLEDPASFIWQPETFTYSDETTGHEVWRVGFTPEEATYYQKDIGVSPWSADGKRMAFVSRRSTAGDATLDGNEIWLVLHTTGLYLRPTLEAANRNYSSQKKYFNWSPQEPDIHYEAGYGFPLSGPSLDGKSVYRTVVSDTEVSRELVLTFPVPIVIRKCISADGKKLLLIGSEITYPATILPTPQLDDADGYTIDRDLGLYGTTPNPYTHYHDYFLPGIGEWYFAMPLGGEHRAWWKLKAVGSAADGGALYDDTDFPVLPEDLPYDFGDAIPVNADWNDSDGEGVNDPFGCGYWSHFVPDPWGKHALFTNSTYPWEIEHPLGGGPGVWDIDNSEYVVVSFGRGGQHHDWRFSDWVVSSESPEVGYPNQMIVAQKFDETYSQFDVNTTYTRLDGGTAYLSLVRPGQSPDGTKVAWHSEFLNGYNHTDVFWTVVYNPYPPTDLEGVTASGDGVTLSFLPPKYTERRWIDPATGEIDEINGEILYAREIKEYQVWRSATGTGGWTLIAAVTAEYDNDQVTNTLKPVANGYWVGNIGASPSISPSPSISGFSVSLSPFSASISLSPSPSISVLSASPSPSPSLSVFSASISVSPSPSISESPSPSTSLSSLSPSISEYSASTSPFSTSPSISVSPSLMTANKITADDDPGDGTWYYAVTSTEYSGLESDELSEIIEVIISSGNVTSSVIVEVQGQQDFWTIDPAQPTGFTASDEIPAGHYQLNWTEPGDDKIRYYNIYYSTEGDPIADRSQRMASLPVGTDSYLDWLAHTSLAGHYGITSVDRYGNESTILIATNLSPSISLSPSPSISLSPSLSPSL